MLEQFLYQLEAWIEPRSLGPCISLWTQRRERVDPLVASYNLQRRLRSGKPSHAFSSVD